MQLIVPDWENNVLCQPGNMVTCNSSARFRQDYRIDRKFFHPVDLSVYILDFKLQILLQFLNHDKM